jgi:type II secretory pathway pseudopilin PulG
MLHQRPYRGFTLIELMVAVSLGMVIVMVAMSGVRVASQTITQANHLSLQNSILRSAVIKANEEMDFWDSFDSRSDTSKQILRGTTYPFAKMNFTGTDTVLNFNPADPRLWWNGQLWSSNRLNDGTNYQRRFGDYSIFGRQGLSDPAVPAERSWRHNILPYISNGLGYYAAFDYLPANFVYGYFNQAGDIPVEFGAPGVGSGRFRPDWHAGNKPLTKCEAGHDNGYIFTNVTGKAGYPNAHPVSHRSTYNNHSGAFSSNSYPNRWEPFPVVDFANTLPPLWPTTWMQVKVTYHWMDFRHQVLVSQNDPSTGKSASLVVHGLTTTLRGARRQRNLDVEPVDPDYP